MNRLNRVSVEYRLRGVHGLAAALAGVVLVVFSLISSGCGQEQQAAQQAPPGQQQGGAAGRGRGGARQAVPVVAEKVVLKDMPIDVTTIGTVVAYATVSVQAQVTGQLLEARFEDGDFVRKGQVLLKIDPRPYEMELERARATLTRNKAVAANTRSQAGRYQKLLAEGVVSPQEVDSVVSGAEADEATVASDETAVRQAQLSLDYCTVSAPIDGYAGELMVKPGNLVRPNDAAIVVINQIHPIYVDFKVPQQHLVDIKRFMAQGTLRVTAALPNDPGLPEQGTLTFVDNAVDPSTGTIRLRGVLQNPRNRLWPGLFVNASLRLSNRPNTLVVPAPAVSTNQDGQYVYVVKRDGTVESRPVVTGSTIEGQTIVQEGLQAGETVVVDGQLRLVPGSSVEVTNRATEDAPVPPPGNPAASGTGRGPSRGPGRQETQR